MKKLFVAILCLTAAISYAQTPENKYVLLPGGGNWCSWCITFEKFCKEDAKIDSVIRSAFVPYHSNYCKENENNKVIARYGFPRHFGFRSLSS